jgi:hypothetical protein
MKFALLYQYDPTETGPSEAEVADWVDYDKELRDAGIFVYEAGFHAADTGRTVSVRNGSAEVIDGGVERSGDILAGLYVVDVSDLDTATRWAEWIPTARYGTVEVRPVVEYEG